MYGYLMKARASNTVNKYENYFLKWQSWAVRYGVVPRMGELLRSSSGTGGASEIEFNSKKKKKFTPFHPYKYTNEYAARACDHLGPRGTVKHHA